MRLTGTFSGGRGRQEQLNGFIDGNQISFSVIFQGRRGEITMEYKGTVDGDSMKGTVKSGQNTTEWLAKRKGA